jgi:hypothetical protein
MPGQDMEICCSSGEGSALTMRFPRNSLGSAGTVSWRNIVIESEKVVRVVLALHRLQAF